MCRGNPDVFANRFACRLEKTACLQAGDAIFAEHRLHFVHQLGKGAHKAQLVFMSTQVPSVYNQ